MKSERHFIGQPIHAIRRMGVAAVLLATMITADALALDAVLAADAVEPSDVLGTAADAEVSGLRAQVSAENVLFSGVSPGGRLVLFGVAVRNERGMLSQRRFAELVADGDYDGVITFEPEGGVPLRSLFVAIDLASASVAVAAHGTYALNHREIDFHSLKHDAEGAIALERDRLQADLLLVRPGHGAWRVRAGDGGKRDADHLRDGRLKLLFSDGSSLTEDFGKAPKHLKVGDVLILIDPVRLELETLTVTR